MVRIPGRQPTAGLERFYLEETPAWMPTPDGSAAAIIAPAVHRFTELADRGVAPLVAGVSDTGALEADQADLAAATDDQANRVATNAAGADTLRSDTISGSFAPIDDAVDQAGAHLNRSPAGAGGTGGTVPAIDIGTPPDLAGRRDV